MNVPNVDHLFPQLPLFYGFVYRATVPTELFSLPQHLRDVVTGKIEYSSDGVKSLLNDQVSLRLCPLVRAEFNDVRRDRK